VVSKQAQDHTKVYAAATAMQANSICNLNRLMVVLVFFNLADLRSLFIDHDGVLIWYFCDCGMLNRAGK